jgi:hypothetical protein
LHAAGGLITRLLRRQPLQRLFGQFIKEA